MDGHYFHSGFVGFKTQLILLITLATLHHILCKPGCKSLRPYPLFMLFLMKQFNTVKKIGKAPFSFSKREQPTENILLSQKNRSHGHEPPLNPEGMEARKKVKLRNPQ